MGFIDELNQFMEDYICLGFGDELSFLDTTFYKAQKIFFLNSNFPFIHYKITEYGSPELQDYEDKFLEDMEQVLKKNKEPGKSMTELIDEALKEHLDSIKIGPEPDKVSYLF